MRQEERFSVTAHSTGANRPDQIIEFDRAAQTDATRLAPHYPTIGYELSRAEAAQGVPTTSQNLPGRLAKRVVDVLGSAVLVVLLLPGIVLLAVVIKLDSPGPLFYRCRRVGFRGHDLEMLKFRKMVIGAPGPALTVPDDDRFTRAGRFLASTKLDELPQLWNVLKGEMSLVGPRPEDPEFISLYPEEYERILTVKPGVTGLCQLAFAREGKILRSDDRVGMYVQDLLPQKIQIDTLYASRRTLAMDLRILVWTGVAVLLGRDVAVHRESGRLSVRRRARLEVPESVGNLESA
jgi:lipopolysaccharide/colanic/teichoic acid biosynthesis glycosyltransferase